MWNKTLDKLSARELEEFIQLHQCQVESSLPMHGPVPTGEKSRRKRKWWEKALLLIEILGVIVFLLVTGISARGWMALRQKLPTDGITMVSQQVLAAAPDAAELRSSRPPIGWRNLPMADKTAATEPVTQNQPLEIPEHLKTWLQPNNVVPALTIPEPVAQPGTRIIIPSIDIDAPIGEGTGWEALKYRVGHQPNTANPGQRGNMVLAAHNDVYGEIFRYLPDVPVGEIITVYAGDEAFRYRITERRIIRPEEVEVMLPTTGPTTTLISCYPYLIDTHRIVLFGELIE
jgi:sortase A